MVTENQAMEVVAETIVRDDRIPDSIEYVVHEADSEGEHANVGLPLVEVQLQSSARDDMNNTNIQGYILDDDGNRVAPVYESKWEASVAIRVWTVANSEYDVDKIAQTVQAVLYDYDVKGPDKTFTTESGEPVEDIWNFKLGESTRQDDLGQTPTVRRWQQLSTINGAEHYVNERVPTIKSTEEDVTI